MYLQKVTLSLRAVIALSIESPLIVFGIVGEEAKLYLKRLYLLSAEDNCKVIPLYAIPFTILTITFALTSPSDTG